MKSVRKWMLGLALAAVGVAMLLWFRSRGDEPLGDRFRTMTVERGGIAQTVSANGTLNPVVLVNVGTQVSGTVVKLFADFNDRVAAGQVLVELDPALFRAALKQSSANLAAARASLKLAEANRRRAQALFAQDYIARQELDQTNQAFEAAQAQVESASALVSRDQTNLDYSIIRSPVSGVVVSRNVDVGQTVAASFQTPTLFSIAQDLKKMQIYTTVAEADVGGVRVGQVARFTVDAYPERSFEGKVRQIRLNSQVQQNVVTYNVVIDVDNSDESLLPGMTAFVNVVVAERNGVFKVPLVATRFRPSSKAANSSKRNAEPTASGDRGVYLIRGDKLIEEKVSLGIADGKFAELLGGAIQEGDRLVVEELQQAKPESGGGGTGGNFRMRMF